MRKVLTSLGEGAIVDEMTSRGRKSYRVEGPGFSTWLSAEELSLGVEGLEEAEDLDLDNSVELPYDPTPQTNDVPEDEATLQPTFEIDPEERLDSQDSLDVDRIQAALGEKYVKIPEVSKTNSLLRRDPERFAREHRQAFAGGEDPQIVESFYLMDTNSSVREAAWKDVREKAVRLRRSGAIQTNEVTPRAIFATVEGDHGTYETVVVRGGATVGAGNITEWSCSCPWGQHAFIRKHTYVGRLCSHAYAAWMELQSAAKMEFNRDIEKGRRPKVREYVGPTKFSSRDGLLVRFCKFSGEEWADPEVFDDFMEEEDLSNEDAQFLEDRLSKLEQFKSSFPGVNLEYAAREIDEKANRISRIEVNSKDYLRGRGVQRKRVAGLLEDFYEKNTGNWSDIEVFENYVVEKGLSPQEVEELDKKILQLEDYVDKGGRDYGHFILKIDGELDRYSGLNVETETYYPKTHYDRRDDVQEDDRSYTDLGEDDELKIGGVTSESGWTTKVVDQGGSQQGQIINPMGEWVDTFYPDNGVAFEPWEEGGHLEEYLSDLTDEEQFGFYRHYRSAVPFESETKSPFAGSGPRGPLVTETSAERAEREDEMEDVTELSKVSRRNVKLAGRVFSLQEQLELINEAQGDDEILSRLDLRGTHYEL